MLRTLPKPALWIAAAGLIVFGGTLAAPFHLDDFALLNDPVVTSPGGWLTAWGLTQTRPLTWFTFWMNYQAGGPDPVGYHLVNLLIHVACIVLVCDVLSTLIPIEAAAVGAALFALHPIQTEAVAYVFARATLLMTFFCLLALRDWTAGRHWRTMLWFGAALLAKEECVTFPLVLLLLERKQFRPVAAMLALAGLAGARVLYATAVTAGSGAGVQSGISAQDYFLAQGVALWRYVRLLVIPYGFTIDSPVDAGGLVGILGWVAIAAVAAWAWKRNIWMLSALILILPSSSIFPAADLAADRRLYLPMVALGAAAGLFLQSKPRWIGISGLACLALLTMWQVTIWRSSESLWRQAVKLAPRKVRPRIQLARQVPPAEALAILETAQSLAPDDPGVASEKGRVFLENGDPQRALAEFGRALALAPGDARAVNNRGVVLQRLGQTDAALGDFRRALQLDSCLFDARLNLHRLQGSDEPPANCRYTPQQMRALREEK